MIEHAAYLLVLIGSLLAMGLIDHRYKLAIFLDYRRTIKVLLVAVLSFLAWDIAGVQLGIFYIGDTEYLTGLAILPEVPIEEVFFLLLLNYTALLLWLGGNRLWRRT